VQPPVQCTLYVWHHIFLHHLPELKLWIYLMMMMMMMMLMTQAMMTHCVTLGDHPESAARQMRPYRVRAAKVRLHSLSFIHFPSFTFLQSLSFIHFPSVTFLHSLCRGSGCGSGTCSRCGARLVYVAALLMLILRRLRPYTA